ncbi:CpaD family pilus assembly lipoprotein [Robbsia sp. Bb-Pol-6]|uniref:CpaD family pilus assembly lipoprotein n=1 Tax=Robbsia betulipollinis TaxID=2981849 RepID=A0ABT3ZSP4_9BURK|nr:CpaD family pilus assembly lipoprotein [Robbsia betulipollinis]MCY0389487.1 CpaD family pilus assembly lipoprotein [Robbsia betulipollinis]
MILHPSTRARARTLALLLLCGIAVSTSGCFKPPMGMPDASVIGYDGTRTTPPDCAALSRASLLTDGGLHRPGMQWGCATYTNLAAQIANPKDVVAPEPVGPADAAVAASAVRRYQTGHVMKIDTTTTRDAK